MAGDPWRPCGWAAPCTPIGGHQRLLPERMTEMPSTRANRSVLITGVVCFAVLLAVAVLLDQQGVRLAGNLVVMLIVSSILLSVVLLVRRRSR